MNKAELTWVDGMRFVVQGGSKHAIVIDTSEAHGGSGSATSPMELALEALIGCTAMDVVSILKKKRLQISDFRIVAEGDRAENHPRVYTKIRLRFVVSGKEIPEKAVRDAIDLSKDVYCSVSGMLGKTAEITYTVEIREDPA